MPSEGFPELNIQPGGLSFPWAEYISKAGTTGDGSVGHGGTAVTMVIDVRFEDLDKVLQELIGYSRRDVSKITPCIKRNLPWKHPYWKLWCTRISKFVGVGFDGKESVEEFSPWSNYRRARLTLQFTRPPYRIFSDSDARMFNGATYQEWNRYVDRLWKPEVQMLTREKGTFKFSEGAAGAPNGRDFQSAVGIPLGKLKLTRRWYQIPEACLYDSDGFPSSLLLSGADETALGKVNSAEFFGCPAGTLLYEAPEIIPQPLPLPPNLMAIAGEDFQLQYDVVFHFTYFDPPLGASATTRGHNCMPYTGDNKWYKVVSKVSGNPPFASLDFSTLFNSL